MASLKSGTTIGTYTAIHTNNISTYALTSIPATISPTNIYIGNAIYFGGANNYFNWDGARINSNVGIQSAVDMRAPIFYDSADTGYYLDPNSASILNDVRSYRFKNINGVSTDDNFGLYFGAGDGTPYAIYRESGSWTHPYPDLRIAFHTGIKLGANASYEGIRFYTDYDMSTQVMSVNNGSDPLGGGNVYVNNSLQAGSSLRAPIFYDSNDTTYYGDFASTSWLRHLSVGDVNASNDGSWNARLNLTGSNHARLDVKSNSDGIITTMYSHTGQGVGRVGTMSNHPLAFIVNGNVAGYAYANYLQGVDSVRAPIFYDSNDTTYYFDGNSTTSLRTKGSWRADSADWDGEYAGKIQYHSNHWYFQSGNLWIFRNSGGGNIFTVDQSGNGSFSGTVTSNTLNVSDTNARYYFQSANGVPSNNLGNPTVTEMALFDEQFNNKTAFYNPDALSFWTSSDGVNFTEYTGFDTTTKKRFLGGDTDSGVSIPNLTNRFRIELENTAGYVFLNQLYIYWSSNSHSTKVHIWVRRCDNNQWYQWTDSNTQVSSWPGHLYLPFSGIPFYPGALASSGHYNRIRIEFIPSWSGHPTYGSNVINLMRMQIWGGYPAGKRNIYSTDENRNVTFPSNVYSSSGKLATESYVTSQGYISANQTITLSGDVSGSGTTSIAVTVNNIDGWGFVNTGGNSETNADTINSNGISYYTGGVTNFSGNATDGALYSQRYSDSWQHQIAGDYRSGMIAVRGKNNGTWTSWKTIIDSSTIGSQSVNYAASAGNADTTDGLHVHGGRNNEADKIVRTDSNGYIQAGWINSDSGNMGFGNRIARIQCSDDNYIRFQTLSEFKVSIGLSGKNVYSRRIDYTTDANYHVGSFGAQGVGTEEVFHYGSGFFDVWAGGGTFPSGMSHIHGINMLHYTTGNGGNAYGWQMASQYNKPGEYFARNVSGGSFSSWSQFITSNNIGSQSVNYASSAGNADTLDSLDSSEFARGRAAYQVLNLDTIKQPGLYQYDGGIGGTQPEGADQANLRTIEIGSGGRYSQMAFDWNSEQAWFRRQTGSTWSAWREFIHSGNIASQSVSYADESGFAASAGSVEWTSVQNKPATFSPSSHTHAISDVTGLQTALDGKQASGSYAAASHTHAIADVTGLQAALDGKQAAGSYAAASHTHTFASLTSKPTTISGYGITDAITTGNIGSQSVSSASGVSITGFGTDSFTYHQTPGNVHGWTGGWASHFIGNHGNGDTYYSQSIIMPFWGVPRYQRNEGGNKVGPWQFITEENIATQSVSFATTSGSATSSTTANRLDNYGINYGSDWNTWGVNGKLVASSYHNASGANKPPTYTYGSFLSFLNSGADSFQIAIPENQWNGTGKERAMHYRSAWNGTWSSWRQVVDIQNNVCDILADGTSTLIVRQGVGYNQPFSSNIEIHGSVDDWAYGKFRFRVQNESGTEPVYGAQFRIERFSVNTGWQLLGMVPRGSQNLEWQGDILPGLSDQRVKENVVTLTDGIATVQQINPVEFDWKPVENVSERDGHDIGFIAQQLEEIVPTAVHTRSDGYKTVKYEKVVPILVQAIKEQQSMIDLLSARLDALEQK